jgi:hypothetical protein
MRSIVGDNEVMVASLIELVHHHAHGVVAAVALHRLCAGERVELQRGTREVRRADAITASA